MKEALMQNGICSCKLQNDGAPVAEVKSFDRKGREVMWHDIKELERHLAKEINESRGA